MSGGKGVPTFVLAASKQQRNVYVTQSAKEAAVRLSAPGLRLEVWRNGDLVERIYYKDRGPLQKYLEAERAYIAEKQRRHEQRNERMGR